MLTSLSLVRAHISGSRPEARLCLAQLSASESQSSVGPGGCMGQRRRMPRFGLSKCWFTKKSKPEDMACSELAVLSSETRQQPEHQFQGPPSKWKKHWRSAGRKFRRREEPEEASHLEETSIDFPQLVQEGQFREACLSIFSSAQDGQDCSSQYQFVAQSMWQVVQQALRDGRHSKELMQKLQSVKDAVEWARGTLQDTEDRALCDSGVAAWGCQLERLLRSDAEAHVPTWDPRNQLEPYLEDLNKAVDQWLGPQGERQLGSLKCVYKACFQEVLLSRLSQVLSSSDHQESCYRLYTWGQTALFGQRRETPQGTPGPSQKPEAESLLNQLVFVTWMSEVQKKLVELIQEALTKHLEKVMICEWENWDTSPYHTFLELLPLLEETVNSVQHAGPPVTSQVQAMVLKQFLKFLERYQARATSFLQNKGAKTFLGMRVLQNCHILRETWWELSQEYAASASLDPAVPDTIDVIEGRGRCHLLSTVRALCQSLLRDHFGKKDKNLAQGLQSLQQGLEDWSCWRPAPLYKSVMTSLYMAAFGEYVQALVCHLRTQEPRRWEGLRDQVDTDTQSLHGVFREHGGPGLAELWESIMELFLPDKVRGHQALDSWLASFSDRFPGFLRQDQPHDLEAEVKVKRLLCRCCC